MPRGRSARSALSEGSEADPDGSAASEVAGLRRRFRILEAERQAYGLQAREQLRRQRREMELLQKERDELRSSVRACHCRARRQQDLGNARGLNALLELRDQLDEEVKVEKQRHLELEKEISEVEVKVQELRKGGAGQGDPQKWEARRRQKVLRTLEHRLEQASSRFSQQLSRNGRLRAELQTLHVERVRFQQLHARLDRELQEVRRKTSEVISQSTAAYDARVEAQTKMTMMKEKAVKDVAQYNAEMKELERLIAHEFNLKEFLTTKSSERLEQDDGQETTWKVAQEKEQRRMESGEESLEALEEVFRRVQEVSGEEDLDLLVSRFIQGEDRNFALFNFVNEQNNEAEALRDLIRQVRAEMEQFGAEGLQQREDHRSALRDAEEQQKEAELQAEVYQTQAGVHGKILDQLQTGVNGIFSKVECDRSAVEDLLGSPSGVSEHNVMSYLGLVEEKTNQLLTIRAFLDYKDLEKDYNPGDLAKFLFGQNPQLLQESACVRPAVSRMDFDAEGPAAAADEEDRPLSQGELRQRILEAVLQRDRSVQQVAARTSGTGPVSSGQHPLEEAVVVSP